MVPRKRQQLDDQPDCSYAYRPLRPGSQAGCQRLLMDAERTGETKRWEPTTEGVIGRGEFSGVREGFLSRVSGARSPTRHARAAEAAVPAGVLGQVLLMVLLGIVERTGCLDLRRDRFIAGIR